MSSFKLRPRVKIKLNKSISQISDELKKSLDGNNKIVGTVARQFAILKIVNENRHFWSPQLTIMIEEEEDHIILRGLYGPKQSIWAMFAFTYGTLAMLFSIFSIWGAVEVQLYNDYSKFYFLPIFIALAIVTYIVAQFGQKLGAEQMFELHHFFQSVTNSDAHVN